MRSKILLFFEYGTLNGGELSLLAMLEALGQAEFEFVAAAPASGMLTGRELRIRLAKRARRIAVERSSLPEAAKNMRTFWKSSLQQTEP